MTDQPIREDPQGPDTVAILLTGLSVMLLTICVASTAWWIAGRPDSEWPAWVEAGATVAAVGAAIVAGFYAARAFRLEFTRERRWEEARVTAQASLVAAWWGVDPDPAEPRPGTVGAKLAAVYGAPISRGILLRNASEVPVTEVDVIVRRPDTRVNIDTINVGLLPPGTEPAFQERSAEVSDLYAAMPREMTPEVFVYFTDAAGNRWERSPSGALSPSTLVGPRTVYNLEADDLRQQLEGSDD